jgi:2-amino-4-hydroxy-6-hydroxymethyldihydropteridine diphosphokinase
VDHGYVVGIGSNIQPERNSLIVLDKLARLFGPIVVSRMYYTDPVGMKSFRRFVNFCAFVRTNLSPQQFKGVCNKIEIELGRNRSDPGSKTADRPADIDLLAEISSKEELATVNLAESAYLLQPTREIEAVLLGSAVPEASGELCVISPLRDMPTTVDHDNRAGLIMIRQDSLHGQAN